MHFVMNIMVIISFILSKIRVFWDDFYFFIIQKPLLMLNSKNRIKINGRLRNCVVKIYGAGNDILIGNSCTLNKVIIEVYGTQNQLILHDGVQMAEGGRIRIEDIGNCVDVGENTHLINVFLSVCDNNTNLTIGKDCLFSSDVIVRTSDSHSIINDKGIRINKGADVIIGNHVWICNGVRIMKGSRIGSNSIIGSSSLVAGTVINDNELAVGIPCKVIKKNISWSENRI